MVSVLPSSVIDCGCESQSDQTKNYQIDICCFSAKHAALRSKNKDWLIRIMCVNGATCLSVNSCFLRANYKNPICHVGFVQSGHHHHNLIDILLVLTMKYLKKIALNSNHSLPCWKVISSPVLSALWYYIYVSNIWWFYRLVWIQCRGRVFSM
jgi:hypothetical protein